MGLSLNMMLLWTNLFPLYFCFLFLIDGFSLTSSLLSFACLCVLFCLIWSFLYFDTCHLWLIELFTSRAALDILGLKTRIKNICVCVCVCLCLCLYVCLCMCMYICMCMCVCLFMFIFININININTHTHKHT